MIPKARLTVYNPTITVRAMNPSTGEIVEGPFIAVMNRISEWLQDTSEELRIQRALDRR